MMAVQASDAYAAAGVDLVAAAGVKDVIHQIVGATRDGRVLSGRGAFCGVYDADPDSEYVYASSTDSVGTKVRIAQAMGRHDSIGFDIVNHCVNDILPSGAEPLFFLDYIGSSGFDQDVIPQIVSGISEACAVNGCVLIAGETASLPGMYKSGDYDLVGFIVGRVKRSQLKSVDGVQVGDKLVALPSSGLHTNGYSLVRKVFGIDSNPNVLQEHVPELGRTLGEALLEPHRSYLEPLKSVMTRVRSLAHITGGSFAKNLPRALPSHTIGRIDSRTWQVPTIFNLLSAQGGIDTAEMFSVFNMGVGMVVTVSPNDVDTVIHQCEGAWLIGEVAQRATGDDRGVHYVD